MMDLSILIVTNNHKMFVDQCLTSIRQTVNKISYEVIVVDNCSVDGTAELISQEYDWAKLIVNDEKHGFSYNNNKAFKESTGDLILILNPDIVVMPGAIEGLVAYHLAHNFTISAPKLLNSDGTVQASVRSFPSAFSTLVRRTPLRSLPLFKQYADKHLLEVSSMNSDAAVDWAIGAALLVSRSQAEQLGPFDEGFFLYVEDMDFCLRGWLSGNPVWFCPKFCFLHVHQEETRKKFFTKRTIWHFRSMAYFCLKYARSGLLLSFMTGNIRHLRHAVARR